MISIDTGATKTIVAWIIEENSIIRHQELLKFPTPEKYPDYLLKISSAIASLIQKHPTPSNPPVVISLPARIINQIAVAYGNLDWRDTDVASDLGKIMLRKGLKLKIKISEDAKSAVLFEAHARPNYKRVLYLTISTGIGGGFAVEGQLHPSSQLLEPGFMSFYDQSKKTYVNWEKLASGKSLVERTGRKASEIPEGDPLWQDISNRLVIGLQHLSAILAPDLIVFGGSLGGELYKFKDYLEGAFPEVNLRGDFVQIPKLELAKQPYLAVVYGGKYIFDNE